MVAVLRPEPVAETALAVRNLSVAYDSLPALVGVDMDIPARGVTALIGPSGCGKSTFLSCLNRLIDMIPAARVEGSIRLYGREILAPECHTQHLRREVGMIFQAPNPLPMSIRRNLEMPLQEHGVRSRRERFERARAALEDTGLWREVSDRLDSWAPSLSGGQQQRLCIARAIALRPGIVLMDEPCSALDPVASATVEALIKTLAQRYTVVVVTHNLAQARRLADYTGIFWNHGEGGRLIEAGPTEALFTRPADPVTAAYIRGQRG